MSRPEVGRRRRWSACVSILLVGGLIAGDWGSSSPAASRLHGTVDELPPGPGREAVFNACAGCYSPKQFTQQAMSRVDWDNTIDWMVQT